MEYHSAENVNTPDLNNRDFPNSDTGYANSERVQRGVNYKATQYVAVSNKLIGQVLASKAPKPKNPGSSEEASKSRVYAICELYRKSYWEKYFPKGFAANVWTQKDRHGVSNRQFRQAHMNLMRVNGHFGRRQGGYKHLADEDPLPPSDGGEVRMPIWTVAPPAKGCPDKRPSKKVFAFAVATLRKMKPCRPADIGKDLGFADAQTCNKYAREAAKLRFIALHVGERGVLYVGRPGTDFSGREHPKKNDPTKNDLKKNGPSHINCKEGTKLSSSSSGALGEDERDNIGDWIRRSARRTQARVLRSWREVRDHEVSEWRFWGAFSREEFRLPTVAEREAAPHSVWIETVERLGPVPNYLKDQHAYAQAIDIARELLHRLGKDLDDPETVKRHLRSVLVGFAGLVSRAHDDGDNIWNFNYLVSRLFSRMDQNDDGWLYDLPVRLTDKDAAWAMKASENLAAYANARGHRLDYRKLTSTLGFEDLFDMSVRLGNGDRDAGWQFLVRAIDSQVPLPKGRVVCLWSWFEDEAEKARRQSEMDPSVALSDHKQFSGLASRFGHRLNDDELSSPAGLEDLHQLLLRVGGGDSNVGWGFVRKAIIKKKPLPEDQVVVRWSWFEPDAEAARRRSLAAKRAAETRASGVSAGTIDDGG